MVPIAYGRTAALHGAATDKSGMDPRLKPAAHQFEASMMQELLKPMEHDPLFASGSGDGSGLMGADAGMSTWSSLGAQSLAKAISDAGGLGIATKIIAEVEAEAKQSQGATAAVRGGTEAGLKAGNAGEKPLAGGADLHSWSTARRLS